MRKCDSGHNVLAMQLDRQKLAEKLTDEGRAALEKSVGKVEENRTEVELDDNFVIIDDVKIPRQMKRISLV